VYQPHPSDRLHDMFRAKPYQGARPQEAEFVFIGLDANYAPDLESTRAFQDVLEYHEDGVAFWQRHCVHHPFLLPTYSGDGRLYHRNFARIGFAPKDAHRVSFVELLHIPTVGASQLTPQDLDAAHLDELSALIAGGANRNIFISDKVARLMRASGRFRWLPKPIPKEVLPVLHREGATTVYQHLHFSNFGTFRNRMTLEAAAIAGLL
jgi:hypothetical protein